METIEGFELSPQQKHLWSVGRHDEHQPYRAQCLLFLQGRLQIALLKTAISRVVQRHEILRTGFSRLQGTATPLQVVHEGCDFRFRYFDWEKLSAEKQAANIEELWHEIKQTDSDIEASAQLRVSLIACSKEDHLLLLSLPAMCADAAGLRNLVGEISRYYEAVVTGNPLDDEPMQYADISEWQTQLLDAVDREPGRAYWTRQDISSIDTSRLPYGQKLASRFAPQSVSLTLDSARVQQLEALASRHEASVAVVLLTCWQILIGRLTEQSTTVTGTGMNGRKYKELEPTLGLLTRFVPIKCCLDQELDFVHVLREQQASWRKANTWQENFAWGNSIAQGSFFPYCYEYEEAAASCVAGGVRFTVVNEYACTERYELKLSCRRSATGLRLDWHYDANCYEAVDVERLAAQYQQLLQSVLANEQARLGELEVVSAQERQQLAQWNQTAVAYDAAASIVELFEQQAVERAREVAVVCGREQLSYEELNQRANQLAHYLRRLGVGPEVRVGLCVQRSLAMVVGVLGILKAGGAYVPLDASYPSARLEQMLADSGATVLLRETAMVDQLATAGVKEINLEREWREIAKESSANVKALVTGANLAYVIYTSGSTGRPKGVGVSYQNLLHTTCAREHYYGRGAVRFLLLSSVAFDSSVAGLFWTLCGGGRLVVPEEGQQREARALVQLVREQEVTHLLSLPSLYELLLEAGQAGELASLAGVIVAGEVCGAGLVQRHWEVAPQSVLYNEYGPTEGSVWSTVQQCSRSETVVPIGRAIANVRVYVLDERLREAPLGVRGELYVGGAGVSRGYLNDAAQTAQKYVPDPFSGVSGARMYRTGDVGRYRREGELEFVGRIDGQVKIRGFRIELGEVEAVAGQHPAVREVVVMAREDTPGNPRLVAYVIPNDREAKLAGQLQTFLREQLPEYMVPSVFVQLDKFPLTVNGKVDRRALPMPDKLRPEADVDYVAPRNAAEEILTGIWMQVLDLESVGVHHNFFHLGGHSLLAAQVISRIHSAFQLEPDQLPLRQLFETPTVAGLVEALTRIWGGMNVIDDIAQTLKQLEQLSDDEVELLLSKQ
jgi:amino acid adenylation domain-containing protein